MSEPESRESISAHETTKSAREPILSVRDLKKHYPLKSGVIKHTVGSVKAVDGVSFDLYPGETLGVVGESGCGKSTLGRLLVALEQPTEGSIVFDGQDVTGRTPQARNIAQVFQFPVVYDTMTVAENLAFPLRNRGMPAERVRERVGRIAEMLDMSAVLDRRASGLTADASGTVAVTFTIPAATPAGRAPSSVTRRRI